jgi:hypothetical protein
LQLYIDRKKGLALILTVVYLALLGGTIAAWFGSLMQASQMGIPFQVSPTTQFTTDIFSVLIFVDIVILILSLLLSNRYHLVFRNASFVVVTILLRMALSAPKPFDVGLSITAVVFGVVILLIYKYFTRSEETIVPREQPRQEYP